MSGYWRVALTITVLGGLAAAVSGCDQARPVASFEADVVQGTVPFAVSFTDTSRMEKAGRQSLAAWSWDFGDGNASSEQHPSHTYTTAGVHRVLLTVTTDRGLFSTAERTIQAEAPAGTVAAAFDVDVARGTVPLTVVFTDRSGVTGDAQDAVSGWDWDFGDGNTSAAQNPSHTYTQAGTHRVLLTVTTDRGLSGTAEGAIQTEAPAGTLAAAFDVDVSRGTVPLAVVFTDRSAGVGSAVSGWDWGFGDGVRSSEQHPSHTYTVAGVYLAVLTVRNDAGQSATAQREIVAEKPGIDEEYVELPEVGEKTLLDNTNEGEVTTSPGTATLLETDSPTRIISISTTHMVPEQTPPDHTIGLRDEFGFVFGPFATGGFSGMTAGETAELVAVFEQEIPPGVYEVVDSSPETWVWNDASGGQGFVRVIAGDLPTGEEQSLGPGGGDVTATGLKMTFPQGAFAEEGVFQTAMDRPKAGEASARYVVVGPLYAEDVPVTVELGLAGPVDGFEDALHVGVEFPVVASGVTGRNARQLFPARLEGKRVVAEIPARYLFAEPPDQKAVGSSRRGGNVLIIVKGPQAMFKSEHFVGWVDRSTPNWDYGALFLDYLEEAWDQYDGTGGDRRLNFDRRQQYPIEVHFRSMGPKIWGSHVDPIVRGHDVRDTARPLNYVDQDFFEFNTDTFTLGTDEYRNLQYRVTAYHELQHLLQHCFYGTNIPNRFMNEAMCTYTEWEVAGYSFLPDSMSTEYMSLAPINGILRGDRSRAGNVAWHGYGAGAFVAYMWQHNGKEWNAYLADLLTAFAVNRKPEEAFAAAYTSYTSEVPWNEWLHDFGYRLYSGMIYTGAGSLEMVTNAEQELWSPNDSVISSQAHTFSTDLPPMSVRPMRVDASSLTCLPIRAELQLETDGKAIGETVRAGLYSAPRGGALTGIGSVIAQGGVVCPRQALEHSYTRNWAVLLSNSSLSDNAPVRATLTLKPAFQVSVVMAASGGTYPMEIPITRVTDRTEFTLSLSHPNFVDYQGNIILGGGLSGKIRVIENIVGDARVHNRCSVEASWTRRAGGMLDELSYYYGEETGSLSYEGDWPPSEGNGMVFDQGTGSWRSSSWQMTRPTVNDPWVRGIEVVSSGEAFSMSLEFHFLPE